MATLAEIRTMVKGELQDSTAGYWGNDLLDDFINRAARTFSIDSGILITIPSKISLVAGTYVYSLPADCVGTHGVISIFFNNGTTDGELIRTSPLAIVRHGSIPHSDTGEATHWYPMTYNGNPSIGIYPIPEADVTDGLTVWFWKIATEMTGDSDVCEIPDEYIDGVVARATSNAFASRRDLEMSEYYKGKYHGHVNRAKAFIETIERDDFADRDTQDVDVRNVF